MTVPTKRVILASRSPRRIELLSQWGIPCTVCPADIDECIPETVDVTEIPRLLASSKAQVVRNRFRETNSGSGCWVLGADTIVLLDGRIHGKPVDDADAQRMLTDSSGKRLSVLTGVALLAMDDGTSYGGCETSDVVMRSFDSQEVTRYVATGEPSGKAGAFAVQGKGRALIHEINGSLTNVIGLPRGLVESLLERAGIL